MKRYNELILTLIHATIARKLVWSQSSVQGGYITKINRSGIEVIPPLSPNQGSIIGLSILAGINSPEDSQKRDEILSQREWRVIVYDDLGNKEFIITESKLNIEFFQKEVSADLTSPVSFLHHSIRRIEEEMRSEKLDGLIDAINEI
ncbi:hypothetical protein [Deinococcus saxicola]|uniref:hypothetical protein n=1 Tax=Deinococcus saxicola TaxID=249406 RepID=UPI0039EE2444